MVAFGCLLFGQIFLGGFDHGVDLGGLDAGEQRLERGS
jgi:hypothetical protein